MMEIPDYGEKLSLTLRILGDPPSMKVIACMEKKRDLTEQFHIARFKDHTLNDGRYPNHFF